MKISDTVVLNDAPASASNRFVTLKDKYTIDKSYYDVCYDSITKIVYIVSSSHSDITPMIGADGKPMTLDEYNRTK